MECLAPRAAALRQRGGAQPTSPSIEPSWSACCDGAGSVACGSISTSNGRSNAPGWWWSYELPCEHDSWGRPATPWRGPLPAWRRSPPDVGGSRLPPGSTHLRPPPGARTSAPESRPGDCLVPGRHRWRRRIFLRDQPTARKTDRCLPFSDPSLLRNV